MKYLFRQFIVLGIILFIPNLFVYSQVAITTDGSSPDNSAMLDVKSTTKGFLPPRVALTATNVASPVTSPATGLIVYNTATSGNFPYNVIPGYYYWNGTRWVAVIVPQGTTTGDMLFWNGTQWVSMPAGSNGKVLILKNGVPGWAYPLFPCGSPLTINHIAGDVAPVSKTVTYGTVTNIPGETKKCWITCNLGADHQATAVNDATEASAGWYWQFNRKQGYKHDGTTRTPGSAWIYPIDENLEWQAANDPCAIELGAGWRIPSSAEWGNVDASGGWTNWNGPWNSALKMHAAGFLWASNGALGLRGSNGEYWSAVQSYPRGWYLSITNTNSHLITEPRSYGKSLRCVKDSHDPDLPTVTTTPVISIDHSSAISGGTVISDGGVLATSNGVCWSTSANPTIVNSHTADGTGLVTFASAMTGLAPNTLYYVRAYVTNSAGTGYGNELSFTTLPVFICGSSIIKNHVAGSIAPVTKTVTYGTVTNVPGEISRCWITSNLGADHQATAVDDATEASAGWYWQFNRKQGFKHDGITRTPNTAWIDPIDEDFNWQSANDPCSIELGSTWRIPTKSEWTNVDANGGWTNWNGPWNSALKIHAAGYLAFGGGSIFVRGSYGSYWSAVQSNTNLGYSLDFTSINCYWYNSSKAYGNPLRCIQDSPYPVLPTLTTVPVTDVTFSSATSGGTVISDGGALITSRGICWSASANPTTANSHTTDGSGSGTFISALATLTMNTLYYVRAYATNYAGTAYGNEVSFTTLACGVSFSINHVSGSVAPVTKTVSYGTVTNIPGEPSKCWITSNLGADHQATAVDDATEASAGWYWQFNHKQGYMHDGTSRTPNTAWITSISLSGGWNIVADPCFLQLGTGWRIPTGTEWYNVDASGGWTDWNGPWNSGLKLHAAGNLSGSDGSLLSRGAEGHYWSSTFSSSTHGWTLIFYNTLCITGIDPYTYGFSIRCLRDF